MIQVISDKEDARIKVEANEDSAVIQIFSPKGIGRAGFEIISRDLPKKILMRFHLRGLENLRFEYGEIVVTAALSSAGDNAVRQTINSAGGEPVVTPTLASSSPYWMKMRVVSRDKIPLREGYIEVEAPEHFIKGGYRHASIHWIDFYR